MRSVPPRSVGLSLLAVTVVFIGGPALGATLGEWIAPESPLAQVIGFVAFALAFFLGITMWVGLGVFMVVIKGLWALLRGRLPSGAHIPTDHLLIPPGYGAFWLSCGLCSLVAGGAAWLLSDASFSTAVGGYLLAGAAYAFVCRTLAHHGYIPFPEP